MKPTLSKEEVEQLDEEQMEAYVRAVRSREREDRDLLKQAAGYWGRWSLGFIFIAVFTTISLLDLAPAASGIVLCLCVFIVVQIHASGTNRRIDAVIRLLRKAEEETED